MLPRVQAKHAASMRITDVWTAELHRPLDVTFSNPLLSFDESRTLLVVIETDAGVFGVGEAEAGHRPAPALRALIEQQFRPVLIGKDATQIVGLSEALKRSVILEPRGIHAAAISGIDIALWDLRSRSLGVPLYEVLGGAPDPIPVYASGGIYAPQKGPGDLADEMRGYVQDGFTMLKMKIGGASLAQDYERARAVRDAIGPSIPVAVDASYAFSASDAIRWVQTLEPLGLAFLEAPVALEDHAGMARVRSMTSVPVAGNELASSCFAFRELIERQCVDLVQFNVTICGGITEALRIAGLAYAVRSPVTLQCSASAITLATSLHLAAALPTVHSVEYHQVHKILFEDLPEGLFALEGGCIRPPGAAGIGIPVNLTDLKRSSAT